MTHDGITDGIGRRVLLEGAVAGAAASMLSVSAHAQSAVQPVAPLATMPLRLVVNGVSRSLDLDPRTTLLDTLREHIGLTGSKKGCDHGQCGACTVIVEGRRIYSCLTLGIAHEGDSVTTIEGLGDSVHMHPMQAAFVAHDGFQCGYCTPGQICSAVGMLDEVARGTPSHVTSNLSDERVRLDDDEIRERMSGNICRCAAYPNIVAAIRDVAGDATL